MQLEINTSAPDFTALTESGETFTLSSQKGKKIVLYFYPKDNTSGCTQEACDFRDNLPDFSELNCEVIGISPDSIKSHTGFIAKYDLNFTLLSDESKEICQAYGVWVEKSMYGKKYMGVERTTFIIDEDGKIIKIYNKVKVKNHVNEIKEFLSGLQ